MTKNQKALIEALKGNGCNVSDALKKTGLSLKDHQQFLLIPDYLDECKEAEQLRNDYATAQFMKLIKKGEKQAIIEFQKMLRQSTDANSLKQIQKEFMRVLIQLASTKTICLKEYCAVFGATQKTAEKQYTAVIAEFNLKTPNERAKERKKKEDSMLSTLFASGKLSEIEMYSKMLAIALYDAENSEYPSERSRAMDKVIQINQRLEEISDRIRREEESDDQNIFNKLDAVLAGVTPSEIDDLKQKINSNRLELGEVE